MAKTQIYTITHVNDVVMSRARKALHLTPCTFRCESVGRAIVLRCSEWIDRCVGFQRNLSLVYTIRTFVDGKLSWDLFQGIVFGTHIVKAKRLK